MQTLPTINSEAASLARSIVDCIKTSRLDDADALLEHMHTEYPETREILAFPVMIAIQRGRPHDAWQMVNGLPDERCPELKALCLRVLGDPTWHSFAVAHEDSADPYIQRTMRQLLSRPVEHADDVFAA
ncbi:HrpB1 family type III secretion system apparatus protein [Paraburkholderia sp. 2C]